MAVRYTQVLHRLKEYGYLIDGYLAEHDSIPGVTYLGNVKALSKVLEHSGSSPGPIIFRQEQAGRNKKPVMMYKLHSMRVNADQDTGWRRNTDPRKTKFGAILRKFSIDELLLYLAAQGGDSAIHGEASGAPRHYRLGPGQCSAGKHLYRGTDSSTISTILRTGTSSLT